MSQGFPEATAPGQKPIINSIFDFSDAALGQLRLWLEQNPPAVGISNILGFSQFTAQIATSVATSETTTSTSYTDLATTGPSLSGLSDGKYLILFGCAASSSAAGVNSLMSVSLNGASIADDTDAAITTANAANSSIMSWKTATLSSGNNTVTAKYRVNGAATGTFFYRRLVALRYANK